MNYLQLEQNPRSAPLLEGSDQPQPEAIATPKGSSPNLIMVHGLATNLAFWYHLTSNLTPHYRITLFDLRGHGRSSMPQGGYTPDQMAEDLRELMDSLGIEAAHLVGHSFGGVVLLHFAVRYPERVQSLVLADVRLKLFQPQQRFSDWPHYDKLRESLENVGVELDENETEAGYWLLSEISRLRTRAPLEDLPFQRVLSQLFPQGGSKRTAEHWLKLIETTQAWEEFTRSESLTLEALQQLNKPTLAMYGEHSPILTTAYALKEIWPHIQFELVPQAGHFFPISQPETVIAAMKAFWNLT